MHVAGYQSLSQIAQSTGCEVTPWNVSVSAEGQFSFDVEQLQQLLRPTTRCVIVNFPHNPTGGEASSLRRDAHCNRNKGRAKYKKGA